MKNIIMTVILVCTSMQITAMQQNEVDIRGLNKVKLLQALFDRAQPQGKGHIQYCPTETLSDERAQAILNSHGNRDYINYINGRSMKVKVAGDSLNTFLFNRDNGQYAAEQVVQNLRAEQQQ